ncbi:YdcF family protein [Clostridium beijerinckii]|uniref:YdcF family protein n=1 Tax=Clostridium beijerinckii TaxID=1520 RepID=UPI00047B58F3|nr:YdcF family protein [Clostridium beijerinckii]
MNSEEIQYCINKISEFLAVRDISALNPKELERKFGFKKVDVLVLLGNSIPYTVQCAVNAWKNNMCDKILISGGIGHSTQILRDEVRKNSKFNLIRVDDRLEADIFFDIMTKIYGVSAEKIIIENKSTNCGDNAKKTIELLCKLNIEYKSLILIQDPTMQLRTFASFSKYTYSNNVKLINYAPFIPKVDINLKLSNIRINGIWDDKRYLELLMGEIPRLRDNENGYGPSGKGFIVHVDIPREIEEVYNSLKTLINNEDFCSRC